MDSSPFPQNEEHSMDDVEVEELQEDAEIPSHAKTTQKKRKVTPRTSAGSSLPSKKQEKTDGPRTRSDVWVHFTRNVDNKDKCKCHHCGRQMSCATSSGTSNLRHHLSICKEHIAWFKSQTQEQHIITPDSQNGLMMLLKVSVEVFREASDEMLVLGELPLAFIESLAWRHFCNWCNLPKPHSRRTATKDIVKMYVERKAAMRKLLDENKQRISLTTDIWVAPTTQASYMVVTAHLIDTSWKLRKLIIGFKHILNHKGETIALVFPDCLSEWSIKKILTITVDNATANTNTLEKIRTTLEEKGNGTLILNGDFMHMSCCAHILNLVVRDAFKEVIDSVAAIRNAVQYVRSSSKRGDSFALRVDSWKMKRGSLTLDCQTRWNSTYLMLTRALKFRLAFDRMEGEDKLYNDYFQEKDKKGNKRIGPPSKSDWDAVERLARLLVVFYHSTLTVSASTSVNAHKCYNEIVIVERNLMLLSNDPDIEMRKKACVMREKFDKYWDGLSVINPLLIIASVLDPRNKMKFPMLYFERLYGKESVQAKDLHDIVMDVLKRLFDEYNSVVRSTVGSGTTSQSTMASNTSGQESQDHLEDDDSDCDMGYERLDSIYKDIVNETGFEDGSNEVELYLKEKVENPNTILGSEFDILGWWRVNRSKYPILSKIARVLLAIQVSSVASESAFSTSGCILSPSRSCLTHYMIEVLMCTKQWMKCEFQLNDKGAVTIQQMLSFIELQDQLEKENEAES